MSVYRQLQPAEVTMRLERLKERPHRGWFHSRYVGMRQDARTFPLADFEFLLSQALLPSEALACICLLNPAKIEGGRAPRSRCFWFKVWFPTEFGKAVLEVDMDASEEAEWVATVAEISAPADSLVTV